MVYCAEEIEYGLNKCNLRDIYIRYFDSFEECIRYVKRQYENYLTSSEKKRTEFFVKILDCTREDLDIAMDEECDISGWEERYLVEYREIKESDFKND